MPKLIRVPAALMLAVGALIFLASGSSRDLVDHTIENSRAAQASLEASARFVEEYSSRTGSLPSSRELESWARTTLDGPYAGTISLVRRPYPADAIDQFGPPPPDGYLICLWRGEWNEYWASWTRTTSLKFDQFEYFILGSSSADLLMCGLLCVGCLAFSWPRRRHAV